MGSKGKGGGAKKKAAVKKKKGKKVGSDVDESRRKKGLRYRAKFGPGPMGIKLNDRQDGATGGVFVKGLVEGGSRRAARENRGGALADLRERARCDQV